MQNIRGAVASFLKPYSINLNVGVAEVPKDGELHCTKLLAYVHNIVTVTAEEINRAPLQPVVMGGLGRAVEGNGT